MEKEILRKLTYRSCVYFGHSNNPYRPKKCYCNKTKRIGNLIRGYYCEKFEFKQLDKLTANDGLPIKNRFSQDYKTVNQWAEVGRIIKTGESGIAMHPNRTTSRIYMYFLIEQTEPTEDKR